MGALFLFMVAFYAASSLRAGPPREGGCGCREERVQEYDRKQDDTQNRKQKQHKILITPHQLEKELDCVTSGTTSATPARRTHSRKIKLCNIGMTGTMYLTTTLTEIGNKYKFIKSTLTSVATSRRLRRGRVTHD